MDWDGFRNVLTTLDERLQLSGVTDILLLTPEESLDMLPFKDWKKAKTQDKVVTAYWKLDEDRVLWAEGFHNRQSIAKQGRTLEDLAGISTDLRIGLECESGCRLGYAAAMSDVTQILLAIEHGDSDAADRLLPLVYDELRKLAVQRMAQEQPGQTLQATGLVHEAYLRLVDREQAQRWDSRGHFFAAAAESMRRILVEKARRKNRVKHGGNLARQELDDVPIEAADVHEDLIALDAALDRLKEVDPQSVELVHLRYFVGLSIPDAAQMLGISPRTADRLWAFARAWLRREIAGDSEPDTVSASS